MTWIRPPEACCAGCIKNPCGSGRALLPSASWLLVCHPTCARCRKGLQRLGVEPLAVAAQRVVSGWWLELSSQLLLHMPATHAGFGHTVALHLMVASQRQTRQGPSVLDRSHRPSGCLWIGRDGVDPGVFAS